MQGSLNVASQVDRVVKKAFGMLAFVWMDIEYKSWDVIMPLYRLMSPHLDDAVLVSFLIMGRMLFSW